MKTTVSLDDARKAYEQALAAEPKFIQPYERLSWMAVHESKWQELVDRTDQWLRLDPLNSADVYYLSSIGNLQTQHLDIAEKNAREAIRLDPAKKNMRSRYILGLALAQKQDFRRRRGSDSSVPGCGAARSARTPRSSANSFCRSKKPPSAQTAAAKPQ